MLVSEEGMVIHCVTINFVNVESCFFFWSRAIIGTQYLEKDGGGPHTTDKTKLKTKIDVYHLQMVKHHYILAYITPYIKNHQPTFVNQNRITISFR